MSRRIKALLIISSPITAPIALGVALVVASVLALIAHQIEPRREQ